MFANIGTVHSYLRKNNLMLAWQRRQILGRAPKQQAELSATRPEDEWKSQKIFAITNKLKMGKKLSASEMEFLRQHSPQLYQKACAIAQEREAYRAALKGCKNKEQIRQTYVMKMQQISKDAKLDPEFSMMRKMAIDDEHSRFLAEKRGIKTKQPQREDRLSGGRRNAAFGELLQKASSAVEQVQDQEGSQKQANARAAISKKPTFNVNA